MDIIKDFVLAIFAFFWQKIVTPVFKIVTNIFLMVAFSAGFVITFIMFYLSRWDFVKMATALIPAAGSLTLVILIRYLTKHQIPARIVVLFHTLAWISWGEKDAVEKNHDQVILNDWITAYANIFNSADENQRLFQSHPHKNPDNLTPRQARRAYARVKRSLDIAKGNYNRAKSVIETLGFKTYDEYTKYL